MFFREGPPKGNLPEAKKERCGRFITASVKGANHADKELPCQDAVMTAVLFYRGRRFYFMAVADGHGHEDYTRSEIGAFLALQAAAESANRFIMFVVDAFEGYPESWVEMVKEDFTGRSGKILVNNWVRMVKAHANYTGGEDGEYIKRYGTTLSMALVFEGYLFSGRIGDSPVYILNNAKEMEAKTLFEEEGDVGTSTDSLCSKDAYIKWRTECLSLDDVPMVALATDGFSDSLRDPAAVIVDFYKNILWEAEFERTICGKLSEITDKGVGDDISLAIFLTE